MRGRQILVTLFLFATAVAMFFPFLDMFLGAIRSIEDMTAVPFRFVPRDPQWRNFADVMKMLPMARLWRNSLVVSVSITLIVLFTSSLTGFALAKYRFPGRDLIFRGILSTVMFPQFIFLIPVYVMLKNVPLAGGNNIFGSGGSGLLHSYWALILPFACSGFGIFFMRQFIIGIPDELLDAARIDGCSEFRIYWQIVLPNVQPALATLAVFTFLGAWNEYVWPLIVTTSYEPLMTLPVGIQLLRGNLDPFRVAGLMRAALCLAVFPAMALFIALQKHYTRGIVLTGLKG